jgi:hypothetical protein
MIMFTTLWQKDRKYFGNKGFLNGRIKFKVSM